MNVDIGKIIDKIKNKKEVTDEDLKLIIDDMCEKKKLLKDALMQANIISAATVAMTEKIKLSGIGEFGIVCNISSLEKKLREEIDMIEMLESLISIRGIIKGVVNNDIKSDIYSNFDNLFGNMGRQRF
jgi:hypothetical protein